MLLTCTEPGSGPGQNYVDLEAAVCWPNWDWKDAPMNWVPAHRETEEERQKGDKVINVCGCGTYLLRLQRILCRRMH